MQVQIPWGLIAIFISLTAFYYFNQKTKLRRKARRDRLIEKRQEYLDALIKNNSKKGDESSGEKRISFRFSFTGLTI